MKTSKETPRDGSRPVRSKRRELFCELYAFEYWGKPTEAAEKAGYKITLAQLRKLLCDPAITERLHFLRHQISEQTVADEAWLKKNFVDIAENADKPADKLRALAALYRAVLDKEKVSVHTEDPMMELPFDDGEI